MKEPAAPPSQDFPGFPAGKVRFVSLPNLFFTDLLPRIDHLGELKITIYTLWAMEQMEGAFRCLSREDFTNDSQLMTGLSSDPSLALEILDDSLNRAVNRGTLLRATWSNASNQTFVFYFVNSPKGRAAIQAIQNGDWAPGDILRQPVTLDNERPNIFRLYETNIGPLTPMIAETLREAEATYPADWIEDAVKLAVENNVRRWRYIEAILRSWQEGGRNEPNRGNSQKDRRRYVEGDFSEYVEH